MEKLTCLLALSLFGAGHPAPIQDAMVITKEFDYQQNRPIVKMIKDGDWWKDEDGSYGFTSSITYIADGPDCQIIVDTGVPADTRALLRALAQNEILPTEITLVISTHYHPDHNGNQNLFSYATYLVGNRTLENQILTFLPPSQKTDPQGAQYEMRFICPNVAVVHVRGHTDDDNVVLVYNATGYGNVSVTGDIFLSSDDIFDEEMWRPFARYPDDQRRVRRMLVADSNYIIPGHGKGFPVTTEMRKQLLSEQERDSGCTCSSNGDVYSVLNSIKQTMQTSLNNILTELADGMSGKGNNSSNSSMPTANVSTKAVTDFFTNMNKKFESLMQPDKLSKPFGMGWSGNRTM